MATYDINGSTYELPDDLDEQTLIETLTLLSEQQMANPEASSQEPQARPYQQFGEVRQDVDPDSLAEDQDWLEASRILYRYDTGQDFDGEPSELAEWGLDYMGWFNYNLPKMGIEAAQINRAEQDQKEAFLHLMDTYDNLEMSWGGAGRFFKGVVTDPTTYIGLGTLGFGLAGRQGAKQVGKEGLREMLKRGVGTGAVASVEGAMYAGADNTIRQTVEVGAGRKDEIDLGETMGAVGIGAGVGLVGGTALGVAADGIARLFRRNVPTPHKAPEADVPATSRAADGVTPQVADEVVPQAVGADVPLQRTVASEDNRMADAGLDLKVEEPSPLAKAEAEGGIKDVGGFDIREVNTGVRTTPRNMGEVTEFATRVANQLKGLGAEDTEKVVEHLRRAVMSKEEFASLERSTQIATDDLRAELADVTRKLQTADDEALVELTKQQGDLEALLGPVSRMDEAFSALTASSLRQRREGLTRMRGVTIENLMKDGMEREAAEVEYVRLYDQALKSREVQKVQNQYDAQIQKAMAAGDIAEASRLTVLKQVESRALAGKVLGDDNASFIRKFNELVISNVFSPTTLAINIVPSGLKTLYRPALNALLSNPFEAATRRELMATYGAMRASTGAAWRAAVAAFRYEQALLTAEPGRFLEDQLAIKGIKGSVIRIFPRLLNASDEFLSQVNYQGFVAGRAAGQAFEDGIKQGLKGRELKRFVKERAKAAVKGAYTTANAPESVQLLINKGVNLGLSGEKLANYVKREVMRNPEALRHGTDKEAIDYLRDVLYKRQFTGNNAASLAAKSYENVVNKVPVLRVLGQLFFRTPVRVFEEGIRLTPGVQVLAPNFMKDLRGVNGARAQLRAQGEALMSMALMGSVLTLYAQGRIVGDGAYAHWKQQRNRTDSDMPEPYTLRFDDGTTWSFKNFDPISTPVKIMVNALERYENLITREQQGEFINKTTFDKALAGMSVGTMAVAQAIRDANLMAGLDGAIDLFDDMKDPENGEGGILKFLGTKLKMLVPNTMHKIAATNDPEMKDPATFWQMVEARLMEGLTLGHYEDKAPRGYDVLGNVRQMNDTGALWNIFSRSTQEERQKGRSADELMVLRKLDQVSKETGVTFAAPYTHRMTGGMDLRTQMTSDGQTTLYDRWQQYYAAQHPEEGLAEILRADLPMGTTSVNGPVVQSVNRYISALRDAAFYQLMAEESGVERRVIEEITHRAEAKAGFWDK